MTRAEADVIEAAQELVQSWEGSKYGPMQEQVKRDEKALIDAVSDLASESEGFWRRPIDCD